MKVNERIGATLISVAFSNKASYRQKLFHSTVEAVQRTMLTFSK